MQNYWGSVVEGMDRAAILQSLWIHSEDTGKMSQWQEKVRQVKAQTITRALGPVALPPAGNPAEKELPCWASGTEGE